jgi:predicted NUDIX family NTP pyrophosphohydrolase
MALDRHAHRRSLPGAETLDHDAGFSAWALPGDLDVSTVRSNTFTMESAASIGPDG